MWSLHRLLKDSELHWLTILSGRLFQVGMIEKKNDNSDNFFILCKIFGHFYPKISSSHYYCVLRSGVEVNY